MLDAVASVLKVYTAVTLVEVQGHTDNVGLAEANRKLSQQRADAVIKYLVSNGIDAGRLVGKGYGPDKPIDDNKKAAGRQANRRVEFIILKSTIPKRAGGTAGAAHASSCRAAARPLPRRRLPPRPRLLLPRRLPLRRPDRSRPARGLEVTGS